MPIAFLEAAKICTRMSILQPYMSKYIESEVGDIRVVKDIIDCCEVDDAIVFLTLLKTAMATVARAFVPVL